MTNINKDQETAGRSADQVSKLFKSKRAEDFIFYFDKLWHLKNHASIIALKYLASLLIIRT